MFSLIIYVYVSMCAWEELNKKEIRISQERLGAIDQEISQLRTIISNIDNDISRLRFKRTGSVHRLNGLLKEEHELRSGDHQKVEINSEKEDDDENGNSVDDFNDD